MPTVPDEGSDDTRGGPADDPAVERADEGGTGGPETLTVGELCSRIDDRIGAAFPDEVWVQGAISSLTRSANGHVYFDLVDPTDEVGASARAALPVVLFSSSKMLVNRILRKAGGVRMHDGIEIRIRGRVAYYPPQGRIQLIMSLIDPQFTLGQMMAARAALLERLEADGLADRNRRLPLPALPLRVALITSGGSAAFADFVTELERSGHPFRVTLFDSRVQGLEAVDSLAEAIAETDRIDADAVVVVRGGGSRTDLAAFDHERVVEAVARCRRPVLIGVGHEIDRSVADAVAHTSVKTPTACAGVLIAAVDEFARRLDDGAGRLAGLTGLHLAGARQRLVADGARLAAAARRAVEHNELELTHAGRRLSRSPGRALERRQDRLATASARLAAADPSTALRRGWTITHTSTGQLVRSVTDVEAGTELRTTTMDGMIISQVTDQPDVEGELVDGEVVEGESAR